MNKKAFDCIYLMGVSDISGSDNRWIKKAMPVRYEKANKYINVNDKLLSYLAAYLLRDAIGIKDEKQLRLTKNGKPYAGGYCCFNISHSGRFTVLAASDEPVGVDIEPLDRDFSGAEKIVFTPGELSYLKAEGTEGFFRLWTAKEALLKAVGDGFLTDPKDIEVLPFFEGRSVCFKGKDFYLWSREYDGHMISACFLHKPEDIDLKRIFIDNGVKRIYNE